MDTNENQLTTREQQLVQNMRFYSEARFKQLTLWLGGMTLFLAGLAQGQVKIVDDVELRQVLAVFGPVFTAVMWILEIRASLYFASLRGKVDLWPPLTFSKPGDAKKELRPIMNWINSTNAVWFLYLSAYTAWLFLGCAINLHPLWSFVVIVIGVCVLTFSVVNYWRCLWTYKPDQRNTNR